MVLSGIKVMAGLSILQVLASSCLYLVSLLLAF